MDMDMDSEEEEAITAVVVALLPCERIRTVWVQNWLLRRPELGYYETLMEELRTEDPKAFRNFLRMDFDSFNYLVFLLTPTLERQDTQMRKAISVGHRVAIALRYLATGESAGSLAFAFRVSRSAVSVSLPETCEALYRTLQPLYMTMPTTTAEWREIADQFEVRWDFPHCCGAIDGKHVRIQCPPRAGSVFFNYKDYNSIILMAVVDANYCFRYVDVGRNGRQSDAGIFRDCSFGKALTDSKFPLPPSEPLSPGKPNMPYVFVGDNGFPLKKNLMIPYTARYSGDCVAIFNYRLSRARRIVENAFGILAARFRVFHTAINLAVDTAEWVVLAACALHNFLRHHTTAGWVYCPPAFVDTEDSEHRLVNGSWRTVQPTSPFRAFSADPGTNASTLDARGIREEYARYFEQEGAVDWQWGMI